MMASKTMPPRNPIDSSLRRRWVGDIDVAAQPQRSAHAGDERGQQHCGTRGSEPAEEAAAKFHPAKGVLLSTDDLRRSRPAVSSTAVLLDYWLPRGIQRCCLGWRPEH